MVHLSNSKIRLIFEAYRQNQSRQFTNQNISFLVSGTLMILITTLFMNACSASIAYGIMEPNIIVMNTVIASAAAGCQVFLGNQWSNSFKVEERVNRTQLDQYYNVHELCGGVLAGLISISGSSANVELWAATLIGMIGSSIYQNMRKLFRRYEIDDPLDNSQIHGFCGMWAIFAVGLFDRQRGLLYTGEVNFLGVQMLGLLAYAFWSLALSFVFFYSLKLNERLRIDPLYEIIGMDFINLRGAKISRVQNSYLYNRERLLND